MRSEPFAVVDKGLLNGSATYLLFIGVFIGAAADSFLHQSYGIAGFWAITAIVGWHWVQQTYTDIEQLQDDFIANQEAYTTEEERQSRSNNVSGFFDEFRGRSDTE